MTREQILSVIRTHLADELEVDPDVDRRDDAFQEDLEADSSICTRSSRSSRTATA